MSHDKLNYIGQLREQGYRVTSQRRFVLDAICEMGGHATATQIYHYVYEKLPTINRSTIYRTLDFFCDLRMVAKTDIGGNTMFEIVGEHKHHHLVCRGCGGTADLDDGHFDALSQHLLEAHGFLADLDHMVISGLCHMCIDR